jgi:coenzyme PQQ precursor peptide PqqA
MGGALRAPPVSHKRFIRNSRSRTDQGGIGRSPQEPVDPTLVSDDISDLIYCTATWIGQILTKKILLANYWLRITLSIRAEFVRFCKECHMAWKTPKIVEVPVGMEINMYACAARK